MFINKIYIKYTLIAYTDKHSSRVPYGTYNERTLNERKCIEEITCLKT